MARKSRDRPQRRKGQATARERMEMEERPLEEAEAAEAAEEQEVLASAKE
jgi:hypothetical protein